MDGVDEAGCDGGGEVERETAAPDPEKWTVVVRLRGSSPKRAWIRTGVGMVEFLVDIVAGRHAYSAALLVTDDPVWLLNNAA